MSEVEQFCVRENAKNTERIFMPLGSKERKNYEGEHLYGRSVYASFNEIAIKVVIF
jgi:hypothetical protein